MMCARSKIAMTCRVSSETTCRSKRALCRIARLVKLTWCLSMNPKTTMKKRKSLRRKLLLKSHSQRTLTVTRKAKMKRSRSQTWDLPMCLLNDEHKRCIVLI